MGMLQDTGRLFSVTDYSPEWSYPEVSPYTCRPGALLQEGLRDGVECDISSRLFRPHVIGPLFIMDSFRSQVLGF
jgi:hypothetical protein